MSKEKKTKDIKADLGFQRLTFMNMISENLYNFTRIRNGKSASHLFKHARLKRFAKTGILVLGEDNIQYRLTDMARDAVDTERLHLIKGNRR